MIFGRSIIFPLASPQEEGAVISWMICFCIIHEPPKFSSLVDDCHLDEVFIHFDQFLARCGFSLSVTSVKSERKELNGRKAM